MRLLFATDDGFPAAKSKQRGSEDFSVSLQTIFLFAIGAKGFSVQFRR
jgi:hypothetical protein